MRRRSTFFALIVICLLGGIAAPALVFAVYRFLLGDGFSLLAGVGVTLVSVLVAGLLVALAGRFRP